MPGNLYIHTKAHIYIYGHIFLISSTPRAVRVPCCCAVSPRRTQLLMVNSQVSRLEDVVGDVQSWWQAQQQGRPGQRALRPDPVPGGAVGTH